MTVFPKLNIANKYFTYNQIKKPVFVFKQYERCIFIGINSVKIVIKFLSYVIV